MGNCLSTSPPHSEHSRSIDRELEKDRIQRRKDVKILLLGAGESGKTTVLKQMQLLHGDGGFTASQTEHFRQQIFLNLHASMKNCIDVMADRNIEFDDKSLENYLPMFDGYVQLEPGEAYPVEYIEPLKRLWVDRGLQVLTTGDAAGMTTSMHYFFLDLDRLFDPRYSPTDQDILQCRVKTSGITEMTFDLSNVKCRMLDVGGQRSERKKWMHCFEDVTAILFLVAISGYDATLIEDSTANQMREALMLFDVITNSKWFSSTSIILFLNKIDLFKKKLCQSRISEYFPDYQGSDTDYSDAREFFLKKFILLDNSSKRNIYTHYTCATDTSLMKIVIDSVTEIILLRGTGDVLLL
ncbi:hypothetical protein CROQUDRAFT_652116 [Cronartium quercuum f. sp. fusiforme G11]|uniref:Uncharacterized protein n=1 Tax=Cronartium quercuum f. sp. fusiforme G11 TaxID=708437 RepID=A0A9P6NUH6_9BASI|nr:hypothetical protein CROQUDRAFT_652116 [Cronartium quercuum f. sp. fusiforme G11]